MIKHYKCDLFICHRTGDGDCVGCEPVENVPSVTITSRMSSRAINRALRAVGVVGRLPKHWKLEENERWFTSNVGTLRFDPAETRVTLSKRNITARVKAALNVLMDIPTFAEEAARYVRVADLLDVPTGNVDWIP